MQLIIKAEKEFNFYYILKCDQEELQLYYSASSQKDCTRIVEYCFVLFWDGLSWFLCSMLHLCLCQEVKGVS